MKILLTAVNAKYIHSNLAVYSLRAYAAQWAEHLEIAEYTINHRAEQVLRNLYERRPDVLAFSCYIWNLDFLESLLPDLPKILPGVPVFLGGPEVSYETETFLKRHPEVTGVLQGEGEETFARLCRCLVEDWQGVKKGSFGQKEYGTDGNWKPEQESWSGRYSLPKKLAEIPGLLLQQNGLWEFSAEKDSVNGAGESCGESSRTEKSEGCGEAGRTEKSEGGGEACAGCLDMDRLPFPYRDLTDFARRIIYYEASRGCPFSCAYCLSSLEKKVRFRDLKLVLSELDFFLKQKTPQVKFVDRTFNCNSERSFTIWQYIKEHDNGVTNFHFEISADLLTEKELELLESLRPGCIQLEIGVQSTNPKTLEAINRKADWEKIRANVKRIHSFGNIHQHLDLIAGLPYEDLKSFERSFQEVYELEPEQLQLGFLKVLKGSRIYEEAKQYGILYREKPPYEALRTYWLSYEDILILKGIEEMVEIYYNSNQFRKSLKILTKEFSTSFAFFRTLSDFYREKGQDMAPSSRLAKYDLLLAFARRYVPEKLEQIRESLIYDLYSREKVKVRPDWAPTQEPYKEALRSFFQKEAVSHDYLKGWEGYNWKQLMHMCHIEIFTYPEKRALLFDYRTRNPLHGGAKTNEVLL